MNWHCVTLAGFFVLLAFKTPFNRFCPKKSFVREIFLDTFFSIVTRFSSMCPKCPKKFLYIFISVHTKKKRDTKIVYSSPVYHKRFSCLPFFFVDAKLIIRNFFWTNWTGSFLFGQDAKKCVQKKIAQENFFGQLLSTVFRVTILF